MHLSALLEEGLGDGRDELQVELGRKEPTYFIAIAGISILETDKQGSRAWKSCLGAPGRAAAGASIWDSPLSGSQHGWNGVGSSGVLCCSPGGTNVVRHLSILRDFSFQKFQPI